jgi:uridine kinase
MRTLDALTAAVRRAAAARSAAAPSLLVGISGIDGAGKGYLAGRLHARLAQSGLSVAPLNVDGWLNLPSVRFSRERPAEHFYLHALRLERMFGELVLPLRRDRGVRLTAPYAEETAAAFRDRVYEFRDVDVVLVEGIFIFKRPYRPLFDLAVWIDCTFETALERALVRAQEGLPPAETRKAYETIYFPAQRLHLERDDPRDAADGVIPNDPRVPALAPAGR